MNLSVNRLIDLFEVDLEKGFLWRKKPLGRAGSAKRPAGYVAKSGYRAICIDRTDYYAHNLIWFAATGEWPPLGKEIDHKNRDKSDNRIANLRLATRSDNNGNTKIRKDNSTGFRGVIFSKDRQKYYVQVTRYGKTHCLGYFDDKDEAVKIAQEARSKLFGEFVPN